MRAVLPQTDDKKCLTLRLIVAQVAVRASRIARLVNASDQAACALHRVRRWPPVPNRATTRAATGVAIRGACQKRPNAI